MEYLIKYSKLGYTDISVSRICLGTMTRGAQNTQLEAHEQLLIRNLSLRAISLVQQL